AVLRRVDGPRLLALAGVAGVVRWLALGLSAELPVLVAVHVLHGLTFGGAHLAGMEIIARGTPSNLAPAAQSRCSAVAVGGGFGISRLSSGRLYGEVGGQAFFAMAALALAGTAVAAQLARPGAQPKAIS